MLNTNTNKNVGREGMLVVHLPAWLVKHELVHRSLGFDYKGRLT